MLPKKSQAKARPRKNIGGGEPIGKSATKSSLVDPYLEEDNPSWMTTYGDLITVILTFFVMLQGLSIVNEDKFSELFNKRKFFLISQQFNEMKLMGKDRVSVPQEEFSELKSRRMAQKRILRLSKMIMKDFRRIGLQHIVKAKPSKDRLSVEVQVNSSVLFKSGKGHMTETASMIIDKLTSEFCTYDDVKINIEGHTDNVPIKTAAYPSNWELSAIRATSVLRRMINNCIDPSNVTATGYGDRVPISHNNDAQGRAKNRRIVIRLEY